MTNGTAEVKSFSKMKENILLIKRQHTKWGEGIFTNCNSFKKLVSRIYKEPKKLNSRKTNTPLGLELNREYSQGPLHI